jgi:hypothetical protein
MKAESLRDCETSVPPQSKRRWHEVPHHTRFVSLILFLIVLGMSGAHGQRFEPDCPPPFDVPPQVIDKVCPKEGTFINNDTPEHRAQNRAKNSFCAEGAPDAPDTPLRMTIGLFDALQRKVEEMGIRFGGSHNLAADRSQLKNLAINSDGKSVGEGTYVVFVGYIINSFVSAAESVNCYRPGEEFHDIHLELGLRASEGMCERVTAEIIPHFRPAAYSQFHFKKFAQFLKTHPIRITGQLFFDGSHTPCINGIPGEGLMARRTTWEIHPVYFIDLCRNKRLSSCKFDDESKWIAFEKWTSPEE